LAEKLGMTRARMLRVMPHAEYVQWQAHYALQGEMQDIASQHPKWSGAEILEWIRQREEVREKGRGKERGG